MPCNTACEGGGVLQAITANRHKLFIGGRKAFLGRQTSVVGARQRLVSGCWGLKVC